MSILVFLLSLTVIPLQCVNNKKKKLPSSDANSSNDNAVNKTRQIHSENRHISEYAIFFYRFFFFKLRWSVTPGESSGTLTAWEESPKSATSLIFAHGYFQTGCQKPFSNDYPITDDAYKKYSLLISWNICEITIEASGNYSAQIEPAEYTNSQY